MSSSIGGKLGFAWGCANEFQLYRPRQCPLCMQRPGLTASPSLFDPFCRSSPTRKISTKPAAPPPLIELKGIEFKRSGSSEKLFDALNFSMMKDDCVLLIGDNGCGKSTRMLICFFLSVLSLMAGFDRPKKGSVLWNGKEKKRKHLIQEIGMVMQNQDDYFLGKTVLQELIMWREDKTPDDVRRVMSMVDLLNVSLMKDPIKLSGGQKKRLALASQLMRDPLPQLFLLDEPFAGVDGTSRKQIVDVISKLKRNFGVIIVTHEPGDLLSLADRVIQIANKTIIEVPRRVIDRALRRRRESVKQHNLVSSNKQCVY